MHIIEQISRKHSSTWPFLAISYGFSWLIWLPGVLSSQGIIGAIPWSPLFAIGACGPLVAAIWCLYRSDGWAGVRGWLREGFTAKLAWYWWIFVLLIPFLVPALALVVYHWLGGMLSPLPVFGQPWVVLPTILLMVTIGGGQEEYGWRGYLLPQLQARWQPWRADLILAIFHSLWHLPLFFIAMTMQSHYDFWVFLVFGLGFTLLINQLYRRTNGSFPVAVAFHGLVNAGLDTFPPIGPLVAEKTWPFLLVGLVYALLALAIRCPRRAP